MNDIKNDVFEIGYGMTKVSINASRADLDKSFLRGKQRIRNYIEIIYAFCVFNNHSYNLSHATCPQVGSMGLELARIKNFPD